MYTKLLPENKFLKLIINIMNSALYIIKIFYWNYKIRKQKTVKIIVPCLIIYIDNTTKQWG